MRVSLNQIKQLIEFELPPVDTLVTNINMQLGGVEESIDIAPRYDGAVIVRVAECEKHPNADKLNVCQVDDGSGELTQVVCGAPNVRSGMYAVWLKPGSTVPSTAQDAEPFVLGARELRGIMSNGMMASPKELGLGDAHDGILEIDENEPTLDGVKVTPGRSFAEAFGLDDTIIEIENKMFTHRPDLFGQLGVAREIAGIHSMRFTSPDWYDLEATERIAVGADTLPLEVFNQAGENTPRFMAAVMKDVQVKPSPLWLQCALVAMGGKPINNVVDLTNYMMLVTAQPTHAYDYDKIRGARIGARMAHPDESITLLNGKTYELQEADVVIADGEGAIGLAGIMGGANSEVSDSTKNLVIEVANFDMYTLRRSSMRHGVFTDALTRFNKGQSPYQNPLVFKRLVGMIQDITGGSVASECFDVGDAFDRSHESQRYHTRGNITDTFVNERLGTSLSADEIATLLTNVEFDVAVSEGILAYKVPFWRTDIIEAEDIVEEVGRLYGFDKLPRVLPPRSARPAEKNARRELKRSLRQKMARAGANEVLTYSFVNEKLLKRSGQDPAHAFRVSNALSPDLQYYRLSLTPSLLDKVTANYRAGYESFGLFELGKSHFKGEMDESEPAVPNEDEQFAFVIVGQSTNGGASYYAAKRYFEYVLTHADGYEFIKLATFDKQDQWGVSLTAPYDPERSMVIVKDRQIWGVIGEFTANVKKAFKLPPFAAGFEIHLDAVRGKENIYEPLSKFPGTTRDISLKVADDITYQQLLSAVTNVTDTLDETFLAHVIPLDIYKNDEPGKTVTFRIALVNNSRTLTDEEISDVIQRIGSSTADTFGAAVV